jgi:hypothetical protein
MEAVREHTAERPLGTLPYARHRPEETLLYQVIDDHYADFIAQLDAQGRALPKFVRREFEDYLKCGRLEHGFLRRISAQPERGRTPTDKFTLILPGTRTVVPF